jgi:Flp pilus assembly protein TadD
LTSPVVAASKSRGKVVAVAPSAHDQTIAKVDEALDAERYAEAISLLTAALAGTPDDAALLHCRGAV